MKVFVTGGAGFIGSHVVDVLIENGNEVTIFDNLSTGFKEFINKKATFYLGDLSNTNSLEEAIRGHDAVIHLASEVGIQHSLSNPKEHLLRNVGNAINLLEAMRKNNIKNIVFSSSAAVYGEASDSLIKEEAPKYPLQAYGASKLAIEAILSAYYNSFGVNSVSLRYFNVYGPRDESETKRAVPNWIKSVLNNQPITLYWEGKQLKDYIFVKDVASAHLLALKNCKGLKNYNIGSGKGIVMIDVLKCIFEVIGKNTQIVDMGERKGDPNRLVADTTKITSELKWLPKYTLVDGIKETYNYYKNNIKK